MHLRSIPIIAATIVAGARAGAQEVRIEVFEAGTGKAIVGANVSLYDSAGTIPLGGVGYDAQRQLVYVSQLWADKDAGYQPLIHVFKVTVPGGM